MGVGVGCKILFVPKPYLVTGLMLKENAHQIINTVDSRYLEVQGTL